MGVCRICQGEGLLFLFGGGGGACHAWRSHAFARGVRGMLPRKKFLNGAFWRIFS